MNRHERPGVEADDAVIAWLLAGDPVIRWQVMRDLLDEPSEVWQAERQRTVEGGWGAELLAHQRASGPKGVGRLRSGHFCY